MKHTITKLPEATLEILMVYDEPTWKEAQKKAFKKLAENVTVPGFRKGKAPENLLKTKIDQQKVYNEAIDSLLNPSFQEVITTEKIVPWARPTVDIVKLSDSDLEVKITVLTAPEVTLGDYKGLKVEKDEVVITEEEINAEIQNIQEKNAELIVKEGPAELGDQVIIDFEGYVDGKTFEGGKGENYALDLGSGTFIPGFEDQLVGKKAGDELDVKVTFPENYTEELKGKDATFKVKVHEVKVKKLPEVGQTLFEDLKIHDVNSVESFREHVKNDLVKKAQEDADKKHYDALVDLIVNNAKIDLAHQIIHDEMDAMKNNLLEQVAQNGLTYDKYLQLSGLTEESLHDQLNNDAERNIKTALVLEKIAEVEAIEITPELIDFEIAKIADQYKMEFDKVKEILSKDMRRLEADVKSRHIHDFLVQNNL